MFDAMPVVAVPALDVLLPGPLTEAAQQAKALDGAGFDGLFTYEGQSDPFFPLVAAAEHTGGLLYTNVAIALPRSPMHLAYQAWDLQRLTGGRFALGLGSQIRPHIERRFGATWDRPRAQMAEIIAATKAIFSAWQHRTPLDFKGTWTEHTLMPPTLTPPPLESGPPPVWTAALGPRMTQMAGELADGLLLHPFTSRKYVLERSLPNLETGLTTGGRSRSDVTVTVGAIVGLHDTDEQLDQVAGTIRAMLGFYGSTPAYRPVLDAHGWGDLQPRLRELTKAGRWAELGDAITDEHVATLAIVGTPDQVAAELRARFAEVADRIALSLPQAIDSDLAARLVAAFRQA